MVSATPMNQHYTIVSVDGSNLADHPQTNCFINPKHPSYHLKIDWLRERFAEGMRIKLLYVEGEKRPAGYIEYVPGEKCWRAVSASGYLFIHCIWVNAVKYKNRGLGSRLLEVCLHDAETNNCNGVAAMTSSGSFMADQSLFEKNGFTSTDKVFPHYELMVKQLKPGSPPVFNDWRGELKKLHGLHIIYSRQCPWVARFVSETGQTLTNAGLPLTITELQTPEQAQSAPSPYAVFNLVYNGRILADHYISETRFLNILRKEKLWPKG